MKYPQSLIFLDFSCLERFDSLNELLEFKNLQITPWT